MAGQRTLDPRIVVQIHGGQLCGFSVIDSTVGYQLTGPVQLRETALLDKKVVWVYYTDIRLAVDVLTIANHP